MISNMTRLASSQSIGRRHALAAAAGLSAIPLISCSPVSVLNTLAPQHLLCTNLCYGSDFRQGLDIYKPPGLGPFKTVMFIYGGRWQFGDRAMYRFVGDALAEAGFLTMIADYRLFPTVRFPTFLQDCASAFRWLNDNAPKFGGSREPPFLIGHSAGAYNAAMLALDGRWLGGVGLSPQNIRATIGIAGPYDFLPFTVSDVKAIFSNAASDADTQPIRHVDGKNTPMLLLAGAADRTVQPGNTTRLAARIRERGGNVQTRLYAGVGHIEIIGAFANSLRFLAPSFRDSTTFMRG